MFYVYLIESVPTGKYYIGQTADLQKRLDRHNKGMEKFTSPYKPWVLIASIMVHTRKDALNLEKKIKGFKKRARQLEYFKKVSPGSEK